MGLTPNDFSFSAMTVSNGPMSAASEKALDATMQAMLERETDIVFNSSVGASLTTGELYFDLTVRASNPEAARQIARAFVLESLRAGGLECSVILRAPFESRQGRPPPGYSRRRLGYSTQAIAEFESHQSRRWFIEPISP